MANIQREKNLSLFFIFHKMFIFSLINIVNNLRYASFKDEKSQ